MFDRDKGYKIIDTLDYKDSLASQQLCIKGIVHYFTLKEQAVYGHYNGVIISSWT